MFKQAKCVDCGRLNNVESDTRITLCWACDMDREMSQPIQFTKTAKGLYVCKSCNFNQPSLILGRECNICHISGRVENSTKAKI